MTDSEAGLKAAQKLLGYQKEAWQAQLLQEERR